MKRLLIFDLDGTLLDTLDDLAASLNHALTCFGLPPRSRDEVRSFIGNGVRLLVRRALPENMYALQNDCLLLDGVLLAGSRGWTIPANPDGDDDDARVYRRERVRLELSLKYARARDAEGELTVMMHYPPLAEGSPGFTDILEAYGAKHVVYGHLHGPGLNGAFRGERNGVTYHQVSCDGLGFKVYQVFER